jgi:HEAT repeat protein
MSEKCKGKLLKKVRVASGKTAGIVARETAVVVNKVSSVPGIIKEKAAEAVQITGRTLKIRTLKCEIKRRKKKKVAIFTKMGEVIFILRKRKIKNIEKKKKISVLLSKLRKCEDEIQRIKIKIDKVEKNSQEQINYHEAILNLNSKEKDVRLAAIQMLGELGDKSTISVLTKSLEDPSLKVRELAAKFLYKIIGHIPAGT